MVFATKALDQLQEPEMESGGRWESLSEEIFQIVPEWARFGPISISVSFHMYFKLHWCTVYFNLQVQGKGSIPEEGGGGD